MKNQTYCQSCSRNKIHLIRSVNYRREITFVCFFCFRPPLARQKERDEVGNSFTSKEKGKKV